MGECPFPWGPAGKYHSTNQPYALSWVDRQIIWKERKYHYGNHISNHQVEYCGQMFTQLRNAIVYLSMERFVQGIFISWGSNLHWLLGQIPSRIGMIQNPGFFWPWSWEHPHIWKQNFRGDDSSSQAHRMSWVVSDSEIVWVDSKMIRMIKHIINFHNHERPKMASHHIGYVGVFWNGGTSKSSICIGFSMK